MCIKLLARVYLPDSNMVEECEIDHADSTNNKALVIPFARQFPLTMQVNFSQIINVCLKDSSGEIVKNFGAPKRRPVNMNTYFEKRFCDNCIAVHFVEVTPKGGEICHGEHFIPRDTPTHYVKHMGKGYELREKYHPANLLPLDWQMAADERDAREEAKLNEWLDLGI